MTTLIPRRCNAPSRLVGKVLVCHWGLDLNCLYRFRIWETTKINRTSHQPKKMNIQPMQSGFSQTHKIGNIDIIANFTFPYICSFLLYLQHMMLINVILDIRGCNRSTFEGCRLYWSSSFLKAWLKQNWQYCHSCVVESLWKTLYRSPFTPG